MIIAMLWRNSPGQTLEQNITEAACYFERKFDATPDEVHVKPFALTEAQALGQQLNIPGIRIVPDKFIQRGHLWIGLSTATAYTLRLPEPKNLILQDLS